MDGSDRRLAADNVDTRPNGMPFSRAVVIERDSVLADSDGQNGSELVDAQRRRLDRLVGPQVHRAARFLNADGEPRSSSTCLIWSAHSVGVNREVSTSRS